MQEIVEAYQGFLPALFGKLPDLKLIITVNEASKGAVEKIQKAGGSVKLLKEVVKATSEAVEEAKAEETPAAEEKSEEGTEEEEQDEVEEANGRTV